MSPSPGSKSSPNLLVNLTLNMKAVFFCLAFLAFHLSRAQIREEDQGGTMRKTMNDLNKLNSEGKTFSEVIISLKYVLNYAALSIKVLDS